MKRVNIGDIVYKCLSYLPHLGVVSSTILIVLLILFRKWQIFSYAIVLLIPIIIISSIFIIKGKYLWEKRIETPLSKNILFSPLSDQTLHKLYLILLFLCFGWVVYTNSRDVVFVILILLMYLVTILEIFSYKLNSTRIILHLLTTTAILVFTKQFCYTYFYNTGDSIVHARLTSAYLWSGGIPPSELIPGYDGFYLFHIHSAITSQLALTPPIISTYLVATGPILIIGSIVTYYITKHLTNSDRLSSISVFFYLLTPILINYATRAAPRTLSTVAFFILLYLFISKVNLKCLSLIVVVLIESLYMILVHHAQYPLLVIVFLAICFSYYIYGIQFTWNKRYVLLGFYAVPIAYYIYSYLSPLIELIDSNLVDVFASVSVTDTSEIITVGLSNAVYSLIFPGLFLVIMILSGLYYLLLNKLRICCAIVFCPIVLLLFPIFLPGVTYASALLSSIEQISRLQIILLPIFSTIMAIGCIVLFVILYNYTICKNKSLTLIILFLLLFVFSSAILYNSQDTEIFSNTSISEKRYFDVSDLYLLGMIDEYINSGSQIYSELHISRYFPKSQNYQYIDINYYEFPIGFDTLFTQTPKYFDNLYIIYRKSEYIARGLKILQRNDGFVDTVINVISTKNTNLNFNNNTYKSKQIYDEGGSEILLV